MMIDWKCACVMIDSKSACMIIASWYGSFGDSSLVAVSTIAINLYTTFVYNICTEWFDTDVIT